MNKKQKRSARCLCVQLLYSLELSDKAEEDLIQYVMDNYPEEIRTDDPDDWVEWLDDNLEDFVKGKGYK